MKLRESVQWFAEQMEAKLRENEDKGGWDGESEDYFLRRAREELKELDAAITKFWDESQNPESRLGDFTPKQEIVREAADVANFLMMLAWRFRKVSL